jgi:two-component system response regulator BaeR
MNSTISNDGPSIVVVEDEPALAEIVKDYLVQSGMNVDLLEEGRGATEHILQSDPDLVILDIMLPGKDGLTICREVRAQSDVPIILQTAKVEEIDRLLGLELGADDYICKPFSPREMVARVKAILRRTKRTNSETAPADATSETLLTIDEERWTADYKGQPLNLTRREFQLFCTLYNRPGRVFSRAQLLELAFPDDSEVFDRVIDSHVKNIRQKVRKIDSECDIIRSVYGVGYSFEMP